MAVLDGVDATPPNHFMELGAHVEQARAAMLGAFSLQEAMRADSQEIAQTLVGKSEGLLVEEEWPLVYVHLAEISVGETVSTVLREQEQQSRGVPARNSELGPPSLYSAKYREGDLMEAYGLPARSSKTRFVADLITWAEQMHERGWPIIFDIDLADSYRMEVRVYENTEEAREYLGAHVQTDTGNRNPRVFQVARGVLRSTTPKFAEEVQAHLRTREASASTA